MSRRPRFIKEEPQYFNEGWVVARQRPHQDAYRVFYGRQHVGWLSWSDEGWTWHTDWSPGTASRPPRFGIDRQSRPYATWQVACGHLARTDVGRRIAGHLTPKVGDWVRSALLQGEPWTPKRRQPAPSELAAQS